MYYIYMLRCEDNTIYTGITKNVKKRMEEHFGQDEKCAKYTKSHKAKKLEAVWKTDDRPLASKLEYHIKKSLTKKEKEKLIQNHDLEAVLNTKVETDKYEIVNFNEFQNY